MDQPVAKIKFEDIVRIIERDYSSYGKEKVLDVLKEYSSDSEKLNNRVWAGALKISSGNLERLKENIETAKIDFRDIVAIAEYPKYSEQVGFDTDEFTEEELNDIIKDDWGQYQNWLKA